MNRSKILTIVITAVCTAAVTLGAAFLWVNHERSLAADRLNRVDYSFIGTDNLSEYLESDLGLSFDKLLKTKPQDSGLRFFPEFYLAARALSPEGDGKVALSYFEKADSMISRYRKKDEVAADFYYDYIGLAASVRQTDTVDILKDKAIAAIKDSKRLSNEDKRHMLDNVDRLIDIAKNSDSSQPEAGGAELGEGEREE